ncbi:delta-12-fatty acid desaturase, partial [Phycomyces blakesleeanus]|uniref:Fatty acid desaturase domain-containing protein n=2 Tax=Phycomyces blakesleeanus TaxID=4837 RepID=A0A167PP73_PHYB8|nr:hypothetical protein PHYBLDRAFT_107337 [Phycomyces blakesleeanus NRRL 1555(-)]OAD78288.1 hypothetical protein PHYBLDRAFT_107337 [Phycomyces blakesleeanus NRRL 1555(-)]|eukprot:XP_018296328.1 hypothetical protein PHYBLDRAFT_107337 [Phycomyces blakesleeanus NRRL 1555(-)]
MATKRNTQEAKPVDLDLDEAITRGWELPDINLKEIRDSIPAHCFRRDTFRSFTYVLHDFTLIAIIGYGATWIDTLSSTPLRYLLWNLYWIAQGIVATGVWMLGHECGHQAFSPSKTINDTVGMILHCGLLVPYFSWKFSHSRHHKSTGHLTRDTAFVPRTRSSYGLPPLNEDPEMDGPHSVFEETPIVLLFDVFKFLFFGWPYHLLTNAAAQKGSGWMSHFNPNCEIFEDSQRAEVFQSIIGVFSVIGGLFYASSIYGSMAVIKFYVVPYFYVHAWLILITFLQHTHYDLPHYTAKTWNFQRGASLTVDRSFGTILNHFHHHICDTHVAHHFFSNMPHYHAEEATAHIKKSLGKHYHYDATPIPVALFSTWKSCRFVEDTGDVRFYKN